MLTDKAIASRKSFYRIALFPPSLIVPSSPPQKAGGSKLIGISGDGSRDSAISNSRFFFLLFSIGLSSSNRLQRYSLYALRFDSVQSSLYAASSYTPAQHVSDHSWSGRWVDYAYQSSIHQSVSEDWVIA
ncbi:hypothetical protein XPA_009955 [Xanthoria parietina]